MRLRKEHYFIALLIAVALPLVLTEPALAQSAGANSVENFIKGLARFLAGIAGLVAVIFFIVGGFTYITSSGNPEQLEKGKRTLVWSSIGLVIVIAAFVLINIITELAKRSFGG